MTGKAATQAMAADALRDHRARHLADEPVQSPVATSRPNHRRAESRDEVIAPIVA